MKAPLMSWPTTPAAVLLLAHIVFLWMVMHYLLANAQLERPPTRQGGAETAPPSASWWRGPYRRPQGVQLKWIVFRAILLMVVTTGFAGMDKRALLLGATAGVFGLVLPAGRQFWVDRYRLAEWEIGLNLTFLLAAGIQVAVAQEAIQPAWTLIRLPLPELDVSAYVSVAAAAVFLGRGGTFIVRGFLEQAGTLPEYEEEKKMTSFRVDADLSYSPIQDVLRMSGQVLPVDAASAQEFEPPNGTADPSGERLDQPEVRRGRMIGNIERQLLLLLALTGSYTAVAFLMVAKGFVRAKEFEKRNYAEYFLIGTLASTALALLIGTLLRLAFPGSWPKP